ncbi:DUF1642 domain-containing protein [Carnobacterium maltaromaticum]|uniref:DUF1642 domain-containing protein n=1 Tax=Carnobacterium maltaromaticum TaxID=2751 RepID=UPI00165B4CA8|nr:DUF1642 domain-containing protein [Carnobacterium maltaromaticum]MBC9787195.1 DUF1642 domain-containing protein [Carnobacterium maltaromaticum]
MTELKRAMEIVKREYELPNNFLELWQSDSERRGIFSTLTFELSKNGDNRTAEQFIFDSIDNFKKVVIPKFVAEFLGSHWEDAEPTKEDKADLIRHQEQYIRSFGTSELKNWIVKADNFILFVEVVMNGYEVEKEKLYYVELPLKKMLNGCGRLGEGYGGEIKVLFTQIELQPNWKTKFTEQEIKSIDERYWAFAVEVEG